MQAPTTADSPGRKVAQSLLDVRPDRILALFARKRFPFPTMEAFEDRALELLNTPCECAMCTGPVRLRGPKEVQNLRNQLQRSAFRRAIVYCRDRWACVTCNATEEITIDHIKALALGGTNALHNLQVLCLECHIAKPDSHSPHLLARHLANLIDDVFPLLQPTNTAELARVNKVRRLIDNIRAEAVA